MFDTPVFVVQILSRSGRPLTFEVFDNQHAAEICMGQLEHSRLHYVAWDMASPPIGEDQCPPRSRFAKF